MTDRFGMFGMTRERVLSCGPVDLWPDEADAVLAALTPEQIEYRRETSAWGSPWAVLFIHYAGEWWEVNREDLCQQVRTGRNRWTIEEARAAIIYGARLDRERMHFSILDCTTDG